MKIGKAFVVIILIAGCTQSRKEELILNTLREKHQEAISAFPEEWEKHFRITKCAVIGGNDQVAVVSDYGSRNSRMYMVGIIFPSNNRQQQILCYTIGENNTELFLPGPNEGRKLLIVNTLLSKEGNPEMFRQYAKICGIESFEMLISQ